MNAESDENWLLAEGEENGNYLLFRARPAIPPGILKMQYPLLISVYWAFDEKVNEGMPDEETGDMMIDFEESVQVLDDPEFSCMMLSIVGAGKTEWHYYARNEEAWFEKLNELLADEPDYPLEIEIAEDPEWSLYEEVVKGISSAEENDSE